MERMLGRSATAPLPRPPFELIRPTVAALRRRIAAYFFKFAESPPQSPSRELPSEWFRYPLP
jgi:hypothetical protein